MNKKSKTFLALILASIYRASSQNFDLQGKNFNISFGILWNLFKQVIVIAGISFVFSVGLRGTGLRIEYLFFNLLLWFFFAEVVNTTVSLKIEKSYLFLNSINIYNFLFSHIFRLFIQWFILLLLSLMTFFILKLQIPVIKILYSFVGVAFLAQIYACIVSSILHDRDFLIELHQFFMQALFFASSTVIPISILPEEIRDILLYIPLVHLQEFIKSPVTGIELSYIDVTYPILFIIFGSVLVMPGLFFKGKRIYASIKR
tara:strand:+ start:4692 stop:5468 length:777 start_codon:yes stop_codon:yes gene_type:complete